MTIEKETEIEQVVIAENVVIENNGENDDEILQTIEPEMGDEENESEISDEVAIAAIQADKEIKIEEIKSETTLAIIEAENEGKEKWQEKVEVLETNIQELKSEIMGLKEMISSNPQALMEPETVEAETQDNLTPQSMSDPISEMQTELSQESEDEKPVEKQTVSTRTKRRLI